MFDKLRRKFILINMSLLTVVFIGIFGTIYLTNIIRNYREIEFTLHKLMRGPSKPNPGDRNMYTNIIIDLDKEGNIIGAFSVFDIEKGELEAIAKNILNYEDEMGKTTVDSQKFSYLKKDSPFGTRIALINIEPQINMMGKLLESFIIIGVISLVVLLIISIYLTNKTIRPIKEAFEKQKQFIADASHELRTPLAIINTNAALILSNPEDTVKNQGKWLSYITLQSERMSVLINEMLSLAKLDIEDNKLIFEQINVTKLIQSMILYFEAIIYEKGLTLETDIEKDIYINGHIESIKKVFSILMDNAIKYTNKNGKIYVELKLDKNKVKLKVNNTGEGIEVGHREKIFERFYRIDSSRDRETGGYGLGLSIAKSIVLQHKGEIYAESNVNKDTTFIIEIPNINL